MELSIKDNSLSSLNCLRCHAGLNIIAPSAEDITFYHCPQCASHYTLHENNSLTDRWGMPIPLVLYAVIFEQHPVTKAKVIAKQFSLRDDIDLKFLIKNITDELKSPTQNVSEMLDFIAPNETALREFLKVFNETLIERLK